MLYLRNNNIGTQVHYIPVHIQPYYRKNYNYKIGDYLVSENYYKKALSLPLYPEMYNKVDYVIEMVKSIYE